jgi:hypothetical protein
MTYPRHYDITLNDGSGLYFSEDAYTYQHVLLRHFPRRDVNQIPATVRITLNRPLNEDL